MRQHIARLALISFVTLALVLAPSVGYMAVWEGDWTARGIMLTILVFTWLSFVWTYHEWDLSRWEARRAV